MSLYHILVTHLHVPLIAFFFRIGGRLGFLQILGCTNSKLSTIQNEKANSNELFHPYRIIHFNGNFIYLQLFNQKVLHDYQFHMWNECTDKCPSPTYENIRVLPYLRHHISPAKQRTLFFNGCAFTCTLARALNYILPSWNRGPIAHQCVPTAAQWRLSLFRRPHMVIWNANCLINILCWHLPKKFN